MCEWEMKETGGSPMIRPTRLIYIYVCYIYKEEKRSYFITWTFFQIRNIHFLSTSSFWRRTKRIQKFSYSLDQVQIHKWRIVDFLCTVICLGHYKRYLDCEHFNQFVIRIMWLINEHAIILSNCISKWNTWEFDEFQQKRPSINSSKHRVLDHSKTLIVRWK